MAAAAIVVVARLVLLQRCTIAWFICGQRRRCTGGLFAFSGIGRARATGPASGIAPLSTTLVLAIFSCFTNSTA